jgi:hypothetical protein
MLNSADWTAIGTGALAVATIGLVWVTVKMAAADRRHDDAKRAEDRARDPVFGKNSWRVGSRPI